MTKTEVPKMKKLLGQKTRLFLKCCAICLVLFQASFVFASFEDLGGGARPIGMGNAFTAISNDSNAILYNPAGLALVNRPEITTMGGQLYLGLDTGNIIDGFISAVLPLRLLNKAAILKKSAVGLAYFLRDL